MKRGDRVTVTGIGRTAHWDNCSFSDQMSEDGERGMGGAILVPVTKV